MTKEIPTLYAERHRPQFHFSPPQNWINDPNGMVYYAGVYHLFYQYNPTDKAWSDMNWGHATSTDLVHWSHKPVALHSEPDGLGYIFSGSAVVDWNNTSGLQQGDHPPLVALFTHCSRHNTQVQSLAYSIDGGENWLLYEHNPVLPNQGIEDFRDPKVFWYERGSKWIMALAAGQIIQFYRSGNLIDWDYCSDFGAGIGAQGGVWECPDLIPLTVPGTGETKWVLLVSINPGGTNPGSATQYFIGDFDGRAFRHDHTEILWADYGPDHYAGVSWSDLPASDGRRILIAWMSNWNYANNVPTVPWRGAMTVPRELKLIETELGLRLGLPPIAELESLRKGNPTELNNVTIDSPYRINQGATLAEQLDIEITIDWAEHKSDEWILRFFNADGEALTIDFRASINELRLDRSRASRGMNRIPSFTREIVAPVILAGRLEIGLRILKDTSSIEILTQDGQSLVTACYFASAALDQLEIQSGHSHLPIAIKSAAIHELNSIWQA